jgi:flavin-dependent dehydrogenase
LSRFPVRKEWPPGVIPLGNAAAALEPIGGEGMGLAIASAALAGHFIAQRRTGPGELLELRREYMRLWRRRRLVWRGLAMVLSRPWLAGAAIRAAGTTPGVVARLARLLQADPATASFASGRGACMLS